MKEQKLLMSLSDEQSEVMDTIFSISDYLIHGHNEYYFLPYYFHRVTGKSSFIATHIDEAPEILKDLVRTKPMFSNPQQLLIEFPDE